MFVLKQAWASVFGGALLAAVAIQVLMLVFKLETLRELRVIILFHFVGTVMEIFKTDAGSWPYEGDGLLQVFGVLLYSGFMHAAVGSYMVRVFRLFELRFDSYPRRRITAIAVIYWRTVMRVRVSRARFRMPIPLGFVLLAVFSWIAENVATWSNA